MALGRAGRIVRPHPPLPRIRLAMTFRQILCLCTIRLHASAVGAEPNIRAEPSEGASKFGHVLVAECRAL